MEESITISKSEELDLSRDYERLRELGLKHIEKLSSGIWTDYNVHDPGITLLELLCYAITDLGQRTSYDIADLLADESVPSPSRENQFYTAREILTCNPVTIRDFRKLLIDVEGIKNAWLKPMEDITPPLYLDCKNSQLVYESDENLELLKLRGLYSVTLELTADPKYGDLNQFQYEIPLFDPEESDQAKSKMIIGLPDWGRWKKAGVVPDQIQWVKLANIVDIDHVSFETTIRMKAGEETLELQGWIKTEKAISDTTLLEDRIADEKIIQTYSGKLKRALFIAQTAENRLHQHRNLCEDYEEFTGIDIEEIGICADIAVAADAEIERILADLYYRLRNHIAPRVKFYTLEEMLEREIPTENIFNGPPLDHGFIDDRELEESAMNVLCSDQPEGHGDGKIYVSDLVNIIMDIEGVKAVKNIILASMYQGETLNDKVEWCLEIGKDRFPRLQIDKSDIVFYKDNIPYTADESGVEKYLRELELSERKAKRAKLADHDFPVPVGTSRQVAGYTSIQEELPTTYGVSSKGISGSITEMRRAQAKQLKAYLAFYDQILANYLAQLANVKNLFSFSSDSNSTYFYQMLYDLPEEFSFPSDDPGQRVLFAEDESPRYYQVVKDFIDEISGEASVDLDDYSTFKEKWVNYKKKTGIHDESSSHIVKELDEIVEKASTFEDRRNRFLDHLIARFGESFSDYVLLMYKIAGEGENGESRGPDELIHDKEEFLADYPSISGQRGKAFDYTAGEELWNTDNVSGFVKRLSKLLGIEHYNRRSLLCKPVDELFEPFKNEETGEWWFRLRNQGGDIVLRSEGYTTKANRDNGIESVKTHGTDSQYYERKESSDNRYYFNLKAVNGQIIGTSPMFEYEFEREEAIQEMIANLKGECDQEGFFLVEHILLRPESKEDNPLPICVSKDCTDCPGFRDPYSFRASLIVPYWPDRFDNLAFRRFFEQTARREAPAHVHLKICWADKNDIEQFESAYKAWLEANAQPSEDSSEALNHLIDVMRKIRSVYPVATLHDCDEEEGENPLLLDNTALGTFKPE
ncbi:YegP family protein [Fodinibius salsisoli]|uniref:DUF1508 domain-containing protein n=1 Tax=Fodinibius salsisoli TaxID=2820877 RepID=A0ABT3PQM8_9BACT|nr:DUF1508 domain-containing protein [Fodinibius salsisoli]MCW9708164.1 DUF1508 domain-containing protein [Fodinibius salsisoli]